jgi:POT family proton-dependent oligopeptide transporter
MEVKKMRHPSGLYTLFATEFWERFSYYGMRALLVLYLSQQAFADGGFGMERSAMHLEIYAIFTGLVYLTPILGWVIGR